MLVYGATPSGIMAAIEAAHLGKSVLLLEPGSHVGGKFGNGIGIGEIKDIATIGGSARKFYDGVAAYYGPSWGAGGSKFEPHVAQLVITNMLCGQTGIRVLTGAGLTAVAKAGSAIHSITAGNGTEFVAKQFIDSSYEGDLLAAAGVNFTVGREASSQYGEPLNGVRPAGQIYGAKFDPFVVPGDPSSGTIPHIDPTPPGPVGSSDRRVQTYTYRVCLTSRADNRVLISPPAGYSADEFEAHARLVETKVANGETVTLDRLITLQGLPNGKFDVNNVRELSVDEVGASEKYPESTPVERVRIAAEHERYVRAFLYFLQSSARLPPAVNSAMAALGYCKDEYVDNGNFPSQLYVREARRMVGAFVMTQSSVMDGNAPQSVGLGNYYIDVHGVSLLVEKRGFAATEGHLYTDINPYPIAYASLTPQAAEATNLLVSVCVSASHVAFATMRVEPTYMIMGQSAGAAASLAIDQGTTVQNVDYATLSRQLASDGQILARPPG